MPAGAADAAGTLKGLHPSCPRLQPSLGLTLGTLGQRGPRVQPYPLQRRRFLRDSGSASLLRALGGAEPPAHFFQASAGQGRPQLATRGNRILPPLPTPTAPRLILGTPLIPCQEFPFQSLLLENQPNTCRPPVGLQTRRTRDEAGSPRADEQGPVPGAGGGLVSRRLPGARGEEVGIQWAQDRRGCGGRVCGQKPQGQCGAEQAGGSAASIEGLLTQLCPAPALAAEELSPREQETGPEIHAV